MSSCWVEYQQITCDAPGCRATEVCDLGDERDLPKDYPAWTFVMSAQFPRWIDKHFCPAHKAEGEAAQRGIAGVQHE